MNVLLENLIISWLCKMEGPKDICSVVLDVLGGQPHFLFFLFFYIAAAKNIHNLFNSVSLFMSKS